MADAKNEVWGIGTTRTRRPLWALEELGLEYVHHKVAPRSPGMDQAQFEEMDTRHKVPFFEDDRVEIGESAAIVLYLFDRHGANVFPMPAPGTSERATIQDHSFYIMTEIDARLYTCRLHEDPPVGLSNVYGSSPVAVDAAKQYVERGLHEAVNWFKDGRPYIMGDKFGPTDILLTTCLDWALEYELELPDELTPYRKRCATRPAFATAVEANGESDVVPKAE